MKKPPIKSLLSLLLILITVLGISSCIPLLAGTAVGYVAHEEGYRLQNPLKKVDD